MSAELKVPRSTIKDAVVRSLDAWSPQARAAALKARQAHAKAAEAHTSAAAHYKSGGMSTAVTGAAAHASISANAQEHNVKAEGADKQASKAMLTGDRKAAAKHHEQAAAAHLEHSKLPVKELSGQYKAPKATRGLLG